MIQNITNFRTQFNTNLKMQSQSASLLNNSMKADTVSFTGNKAVRFVEEGVLAMLKQLEKEQPVIGFKGNGKWLLPNLRYNAGERFNLYLPTGEQLSYHRGCYNDCANFSLKKNIIGETTLSRVNLPNKAVNNESSKLLKTPADKVLVFRVNTADARQGHGDFKAGQIEKLSVADDGSIEEISNLSETEFNRINNLLKECLPNFF